MWAKLDQPGSVFYDITWTGFCGDAARNTFAKVFEIVRDARDAAVEKGTEAIAAGRRIRGFEVDDAARALHPSQRFGDRFVHRTGHPSARKSTDRRQYG